MNSCEVELSLIHRLPSVKYILIATQKERAAELQAKLDNFRNNFMGNLTIEIRIEQGLAFANSDCPTCLIYGISCHVG